MENKSCEEEMSTNL